jgi:hypothetical protein
MAQVAATVALSVGVRWGPVATLVNGTVVARRTRTTLAPARQQRLQLHRRVSHCLVGKGARQVVLHCPRGLTVLEERRMSYRQLDHRL